MIPERPSETFPSEELVTLVGSAMQGKRETLPALCDLLNKTPALQHALALSTTVQNTWLNVISGQDLLSHEVVEREAEALRVSLTTDPSNAIDRLLIDQVVISWLALQHALRRAGEQMNQCGAVGLTATLDNHLTACQKRFLAAIRELARVRALLQPKQKLQVNIANQQVNVG